MRRPFSALALGVIAVVEFGCIDEPSLNEACDHAARCADKIDYGECVEDVISHLDDDGDASVVDDCLFTADCETVESCLDFPDVD